MHLSSTAAAEREARAAMEVLALKLLALEGKRRKAFNLTALPVKIARGLNVRVAPAARQRVGMAPGDDSNHTIIEFVGDHPDTDPDTKVHLLAQSGFPRWVRAADLLPGGSTAATATSPKEHPMQMNQLAANAALLALAERLRHEHSLTWGEAARLAAEQRPDLADAARPVEAGATATKSPSPAALHLSAALESKCEDGSTPFYELCAQYASEARVDLRTAVRTLASRFPELAESR